MKHVLEASRVRRLIATTSVAALMALAARAEAATMQVMFQGDPYEITAISAVVKGFEAANQGTTIELINTPHDSYNEKVGAAASATAMPDVMMLDAPFLANYVWSGFLQPISGLIDKAILDDMTTSNVSQGTYPPDKALYAVSLIDSTVALYGSRKRLQAIGARIPASVGDAWTKDELADVLTKLSKVEGVRWPIDLFRGYGVKTEWIAYGYEPVLVSMGCDLIDRSTWKAAGTLDSKACVDAVTLLQSWVKKGWVVPNSAGTNQFYAEGHPAGLAWGGFWFYAEAHAQMGDDLVVMPLPKFGAKSASPNGTWIWSITKSAKDPKLAGKFLSYMLADESFRQAYRDHSGFPGLKSFAQASPLYSQGGAMAVAYEQASTSAVPRPPHPAYPTITLAFMTAIDAVFNDADPQAELTKAAKKIDADIEDNDGYPPFGTGK